MKIAIFTFALAASLLVTRSAAPAADPCAELFGQKSKFETPNAINKTITESELSKITEALPCIKHFPWPQGEFLDVKPERLRQINDGIERVCKLYKLSPELLTIQLREKAFKDFERTTAAMLTQGVDPDHLMLYSQFMYIAKLRGVEEHAKIVKLVESIRKEQALVPEAVPRVRYKIQTSKGVKETDIEESTYYSKTTLTNNILLFEAEAKAKVYKEDPAKLIQATADFLEHRDTLKGYAVFENDPTELLLETLGASHEKLAKELKLGGEYWEQTTAIESMKGVAGFLEDEVGKCVFLRGANQNVSAISFSKFGSAKLLTEQQATKRYSKYMLQAMEKYSTDDMRLFSVLPAGDGVSVSFSGKEPIALTKQEFESLLRGEPLASDHALSKSIADLKNQALTLFTHPMMVKEGPELQTAKNFLFGLRRAYPDIRIFRDPLSPKTAERAKQLSEKSLPEIKDLRIVVAENSFKVPMNATIKNIQAELANLGAAPEVFSGKKFTGPEGQTLVVITGHTSEELAKYVREMGEMGYFKGNYVVFNSCESALTEQLINEIMGRFGATAVFAYEKKIGIDSVQQYLIDFVKRVRDGKGGTLIDNLFQILHKNKLNGIWSLCRAKVVQFDDSPWI